jgi:hypothetical protein
MHTLAISDKTVGDHFNMMRKNIYISVLALGIIVGNFMQTAEADDNGYEIAGGIGMSMSDLGSTEGIFLGAWISRLSPLVELRIEPNAEFIEAKNGQSLSLFGVSPVVRFGNQGQSLNPFFDVGVGLSIGSRTTLLDRIFGSNFFFSPTAGAGVKFGSSACGTSLFARWVHHSNAGLSPPNNGIDSLYLLLGYRF